MGNVFIFIVLRNVPNAIQINYQSKDFYKSTIHRKKVKVTQSSPTLCNPMVYAVHGILQARILEWGAFPLSRGSSQPRDRTQVSCIPGGFFTSWATKAALCFVFPASLMQSTVAKQETRLRAGRGRKRVGWDWRSALGTFPEACLPGRSCARDRSEALFSSRLLHPISRSVCLWVLLASSQRGNFLLCLKKKKKNLEGWVGQTLKSLPAPSLSVYQTA